jgi:hypothetical protein
VVVKGVHSPEWLLDETALFLQPEILRSQVSVLREAHLKRREPQRLNCTLAQADPLLAEAHRIFRPGKPASSNSSMPRCVRPPS